MTCIKMFAHAVLLVFLLSVTVFPQKMSVEDVLSKHLDSLGTAANRNSGVNRMIVGEAEVKSISTKSPTAQGRVVFASAGEKFFWGLSLNAADYPSEKISFDGKKVHVGYVRAGQRSILGNFIQSNGLVLEEGLLGGTLSTAWAPLNLSNKKAKITFDGDKKIDGREVYVLRYTPKNGSLDVRLFFDKENFRHVRTEYKRTFSAAIGRTVDESARNSESRLKVIESFSDFKTRNNLTLPHSYMLTYSITGQNGTTEIEWKFNLNEFAFNQKLADDAFNIEN
jgi:hypothetical protein